MRWRSRLAAPPHNLYLAYVYSLFNNQIATSRGEVWSDVPTPDYPASLFDPNQPRTNPNYGKTTSRQEPRLVRGAIKISF